MKKDSICEIIQAERKLYLKSSEIFERFTRRKRYLIWRYIAAFRMMQYYQYRMTTGVLAQKFYFRLMFFITLRKMRVFGERCGVEIASNCRLGKNINIFHGGVIISAATIGENCTIRGNTVIGNKGLKKYNGEPTIGNNVEIGAGANIIGNITIADGCEIGANSVVTKDFLEPNSIIVGVPGIRIER